MKTTYFLLLGFLLMICSQSLFAGTTLKAKSPQVQSGSNTINVSAAPELFQLAQAWADNFRMTNPSAQISVDQFNPANGQSMEHLLLVPGDNIQAGWKMVVGRDVVVPIVNANNPMLNLLYQNGISQDKFSLLFNSAEKRNWSFVLKGGQNSALQLVVPNDAKMIAALESFAKTNFNSYNGKSVQTAAEVLSVVQSDKYAIGFCKLNDLKANVSATGMEMIRILPIDKNGNGRLDNFENIYKNLDEFTHGVWIGKYPTVLSNNIYAVASTKPTNQNELAFLNWIMADGQNLLGSNGFCDLTSSEKRSNIASLLAISGGNLRDGDNTSSPQNWPVILTIVILLGIFTSLFYYSKKQAESMNSGKEIQIAPLLIENAIDVPKGLYFDKTHTWAFMEQDGNVKVGIDDFIQHITGRLTKIGMKKAGEKVRKGEKIMTIVRDGKQLNLYAPISGTILQQNKALELDSSIANTSPYSAGWVYLIEPKNWLREIQFMFMGEKYAEWIKDEFVRLKDFISASVKTNDLVYAHVILQDGGELTDNVLAEMEPRVWEDFQTRFIDTSR